MHIPEEAIEAAARADWASYTEARGKDAFGDYPTFDSLPAYIQDKYRDDVRPMIEAAAPLIAPRPITTTEGLDALPNGSVIRDAQGLVAEKTKRGWETTGLILPLPIILPATLLHIPMNDTPGGEPHGR